MLQCLSFSCSCMTCLLCGIPFLISWPGEHTLLLPNATQALFFQEAFAEHPFLPSPCLILHPGVTMEALGSLSCWVDCLEHCTMLSWLFVFCSQYICSIIFKWMQEKCVLNPQSSVFKVNLFRFILFPVTWFSYLHLRMLAVKIGFLWSGCSYLSAVFPVAFVLLPYLVTNSYHKKQ